MNSILKKLSILYLFLFVTQISKANTTKNDTVICPIDGEVVIFKITTGMNSLGTYMDLEKTGTVGDFYSEVINTCPKCHFSGYIENFRKIYKEEVLKYVKDFVLTLKDRSVDEVSQCEMAAEILNIQKADNREIAYAYLLASYKLRTTETFVEKRKDLQHKVIEFYDQAIQLKEYDDNEKATYLFLIGDMYRRVSDFEMALKYYDKASIEKKKTKWVKNALEQMRPLAEKKDANNKI